MKHQFAAFNFGFHNVADDSVDINIDGIIVDAETQQILKDYFGDETSVSFRSFRDQITKQNYKKVNVYINSSGGTVTDAMAMHDLLVDMQSKGITVNTHIRGLAASAATYIAMASDNSTMSQNSWFMIHNVSGGAWGDINAVENYVKMMRKFNNSIRDFYANKTGLRKEDVTKLMDNETWMNAEEAKEKGFIKNITGQVSFSNAIQPEHWQYSNKAILNTYNSFIKNQDQMDIKAITTAMTDAIKNAFASFKNTKPEDQETAIENITKSVTDTLTNALSPVAGLEETLKNTISETVTNAIAGLKLDETIKNQITEATKDFAKATDLENFKTSVAEKLGNKAPETETPGDRKITNKKDVYRGIGEFQDA